MNQVFSFDRWWLLVKKHWYENRKRYLLAFITVAGLMIVFYAIYILLNGTSYFYTPLQAIFFFIGLFLVGCLFASVLFTDLASKPKAIAYLTVPASHLEKLLCGLFYGLILFTMFYTAVFYPINATAVKISNSERYEQWLRQQQIWLQRHTQGLYGQEMREFKNAPVVNVLHFDDDNEYTSDEDRPLESREPNYYLYVWLIFLAVHAFYALGSVYYGEYSFIKTTVSALALAAFFFILFQLIGIFFPAYGDGLHYYFTSAATDYDDAAGVRFIYEIPKGVIGTEVFLLKYLFAPLFWCVAFLRLKEKEI